MTQLSPLELKSLLTALARQIGFDSCRVTVCDEPAHALEFRTWLREGEHGEMNYMERGEEKRCDPQKVLPGARSIVVLALNYWQGEEPNLGRDAALRRLRTAQRAVPTVSTAAGGRIARYAWGDDYHDVITAK